MSDQYVGEVRLVGFNFAPIDWQICNGALLAISEYAPLFNLIGTYYGGDGQSTFGLPNLQGRIPIHQGTGTSGTTYVIGQTGGVESVTINASSYPAHNHSLFASTASGNSAAPTGKVAGGGLNVYTNLAPDNAMLPQMVGYNGGGNQPHNNLQPLLTLNWIIALYGVYPSQN
ncbi:MAG: tail fiber protein [Terracidiphilus sp.]|jgi:microcystin-dependent protein